MIAGLPPWAMGAPTALLGALTRLVAGEYSTAPRPHLSVLHATQVARLGGLAVSRGKDGQKHMRELSRMAVAAKRGRTAPTLREWVKTPAGRKAMARVARDLGTTPGQLASVIGAASGR